MDIGATQNRSEPLLGGSDAHPRPNRPIDAIHLFDETNEMLLASTLMYALADLRKLARKGILEEDGAVVLNLPCSTRDIVRLVAQNAPLIREQLGPAGTELYLSAVELIHETIARQEVVPETGETAFVEEHVVVFDDDHSDTELVYGIIVNSARYVRS